MADSFHKGATVHWNWGSGTASGKVVDTFERRVSRTLKGKRVSRNGTQDNPAYLIEQEEGAKVLKRGSELEKG
ncbi:DUF2945 domain-containing protein [Novosphingobium sp. Leaf2]|uniref:DUF2945 domain-containing protein n=1 Tax=Novosphingobium sp. Leaf2 TaxID=1735670 RepID=UPI0006F43656|nr:DUF2945 domain-containing protein [Novosphingobium sp. Leaf2]KQM21559.1 hypothetical protein ASE49_14235 [Novosphingobium sp. Leaf2]